MCSFQTVVQWIFFGETLSEWTHDLIAIVNTCSFEHLSNITAFFSQLLSLTSLADLITTYFIQEDQTIIIWCMYVLAILVTSKLSLTHIHGTCAHVLPLCISSKNWLCIYLCSYPERKFLQVLFSRHNFLNKLSHWQIFFIWQFQSTVFTSLLVV